ncbi:uncharacterized protein M6B38_199820 [Iris pallida]|uniref:Zinc finger PHD-type domain-containing protein n=1 Tax=Iris pallida TaxID=29817 RepID=A0AAX6EAZ9_IRIPA|nr:uncharacterized protein M6B38_199820 [Iris pallida]
MEEHQPQATTESDESADIEDVKVCDICGDAGQEELLAICSRCTDGAEHTYCMRKKLHELPEGDWLCEECKIKEETENADNSEPILGEQEVLQLNESASNPRPLQELDTKVHDSGVHGTSEEVYAETDLHSSKKVSDSTGVSIAATISKAKTVLYQELDTKVNDSGVHGTNKEVDAETDLNPSKKVSDSSDISIGLAISKAKSVLSRGSSFGVLEARKLKQAQQAASSGGPLSKSVSFNNTNAKPKVKQLVGSIPQNQILSRQYVSSDTRKEGMVKSMIQSASFKSPSSGCFTVEPINKVQAIHSSQPVDHRVLKEEQRKIVEKGSSIVDRPLINPPPVTGDSNCPNPEAAHRSESNVLQINRKSLDTDIAGSELKKALYISKNIGRTPATLRGRKPQTDCMNNVNPSSIVADRSCSIPNTVLQRTAPRDIDLTFSNIGKKEASRGSRSLLHCKKCNEVGHTTERCSIDKLHVFALKPSADRNLKEVHNKSSKWKDAVDASLSKFTIGENITLPNHSEKSSMNNAELHCGQPSKGFRFDSSSCQDTIRTSVSDPSKPAPASDVNLQAVQQVEASCSPRENDSNPTVIASDSQMKVKTPSRLLSSEPSVLPDISPASVIPELEFIWQGGFEVSRCGRLYKLCDGVQAHLSTSASPKVLEAATKFPCKVQLEEVTRVSSWPWQFQGKIPEENNIGLFFFAKDFESYEKNYWKLLEDMIKNDLALKGNIEGAELLVFPSNKLPANSQRWNKLFFLWGVFRGKSLSCFETVPHFHEKPRGSSLEPSVQDMSTPLSELPISQKLCSRENLDDEIPVSDGSPKVKGVKYADSVDLQPILSSGMQMNATQLSNRATSSDTFLKNTDLAGKKVVDPQFCKEMEGADSLMSGEAGGIDKLGENKIESSPNRKHSLPTSMGVFSHDSDGNVRSSAEVMQLKDSIFPPVDDRREHKKMKLGSRGILDLNSSQEDNFEPDGRIFFPMDVDFVKDRKSDTVVNVQSLGKDGPSVPQIPNLELELGGKKEFPQEKVTPKIRDDMEASLSLSLAFCASKKE